MSHPLDGAVLRCQRADRHLSEADSLINTFALACKNNIVSNDNHKTIQIAFPPVPPDLAIVVSDAIHNFRAAFDYLVYELALLDSGKPQDETQFLIEDVKSDPVNPKRGFDARCKHCLKGLSVAHINAIERCQPYNGVQWAKSLRDISKPRQASNPHRHLHKDRQLLVRIDWRPDGEFRGAEKLNFDGDVVYDSYNLEIDAHNAIAIAGSDPSEPSLMVKLRGIQLGVHGCIDAFKPEF